MITAAVTVRHSDSHTYIDDKRRKPLLEVQSCSKVLPKLLAKLLPKLTLVPKMRIYTLMPTLMPETEQRQQS